MNPLRDRSTEKAANKFLRELRDGHCDELLAKWEHDYHKKYAKYICQSEAQHPLLSWELVDWEDAPPLIILHYRGKRPSNAAPNQPGIDQDLFTVTIENQSGRVGRDQVRRDVLRIAVGSLVPSVFSNSCIAAPDASVPPW